MRHRWLLLGFMMFVIAVGRDSEASEPAVFACNEFPPFKMENSESGLKGFDVEFIEEIFRRAELPVEIVYMPWKRALREAKRGSVHAVCSCSRTTEREEFLEFSEPLGLASSGLFRLKGRKFSPPAVLEGVGDRSVGVVLGYNLIEKLEAAKVQNIIQLSSEVQAAKVLINGRTDYLYGYEAPVRFYLSQLGKGSNVVYHELSYSEYYSCFSKAASGSDALLKTFNKHLQAIRADGTYNEIRAKYR